MSLDKKLKIELRENENMDFAEVFHEEVGEQLQRISEVEAKYYSLNPALAFCVNQKYQTKIDDLVKDYDDRFESFETKKEKTLGLIQEGYELFKEKLPYLFRKNGVSTVSEDKLKWGLDMLKQKALDSLDYEGAYKGVVKDVLSKEVDLLTERQKDLEKSVRNNRRLESLGWEKKLREMSVKTAENNIECLEKTLEDYKDSPFIKISLTFDVKDDSKESVIETSERLLKRKFGEEYSALENEIRKLNATLKDGVPEVVQDKKDYIDLKKEEIKQIEELIGDAEKITLESSKFDEDIKQESKREIRERSSDVRGIIRDILKPYRYTGDLKSLEDKPLVTGSNISAIYKMASRLGDRWKKYAVNYFTKRLASDDLTRSEFSDILEVSKSEYIYKGCLEAVLEKNIKKWIPRLNRDHYLCRKNDDGSETHLISPYFDSTSCPHCYPAKQAIEFLKEIIKNDIGESLVVVRNDGVVSFRECREDS